MVQAAPCSTTHAAPRRVEDVQSPWTLHMRYGKIERRHIVFYRGHIVFFLKKESLRAWRMPPGLSHSLISPFSPFGLIWALCTTCAPACTLSFALCVSPRARVRACAWCECVALSLALLSPRFKSAEHVPAELRALAAFSVSHCSTFGPSMFAWPRHLHA